MSYPLHGGFPLKVFVYFGASAFQAVLSIALLPLATQVLGPAEYGSYAYAMAVTALASALSDPGGGIVLSGHYGVAQTEDRRRMLSTILVASTGLASGIGVTLYFAWPLLALASGNQQVVSATGVVLACLSVPLRAMIASGTSILVLQARSGLVGTITLAQASLTFAGSLLGLFWWRLGADALLLGNTVGMIAGALVMAGIFRTQFAKPSAIWFRRLALVAPSALAAGITDGLRPVIESAVLVRGSGMNGLGLYNHSKVYYSYLMQVTNAFAYALWPQALAEARTGDGHFAPIERAWNAIYLLLTAAGMVFAAFGGEIVALLTNGKFGQSAFWIPIWVAYLLIQNSGKAATAILFAAGYGGSVSHLRAGTVLCSLVIMVFLVPRWGISAAVGIAIADIVLFRVLIHFAARRIQAVPDLDRWCFGGCVLIGVSTAVFHGLPMSFLDRCGILVFSLALLALAGRHIISDGWRQLQAVFALRGRKAGSF